MVRSVFLFCLWGLCSVSPLLAAQTPYAFSLQGPEGQVTDRDFSGKYLLLAFGYTSCPDICPTTLYKIAKVLKKIEHPDLVQPLFVSIDPSNDTQERLSKYVQYFDPRIVGLTADYRTLKKMADAYGASFGYRFGDEEVTPPDLPPTHSVYHSTLLYFLSPERRMVDVFDYQTDVEEMVKRIDAVIGRQAPPAKEKTGGGQDNAAVYRDNCPLPRGFTRYTGNAPALKTLLHKTEDRPTLVNFWALWCVPCRKELPLLDRLAGGQSSLAVHVFDLDDKPHAIRQQFDRLGITHLGAESAGDGDLLTRFHGVGLPFSVLFVHGRPVASKNGVIEETRTLERWAICAGK